MLIGQISIFNLEFSMRSLIRALKRMHNLAEKQKTEEPTRTRINGKQYTQLRFSIVLLNTSTSSDLLLIFSFLFFCQEVYSLLYLYQQIILLFNFPDNCREERKRFENLIMRKINELLEVVRANNNPIERRNQIYTLLPAMPFDTIDALVQFDHDLNENEQMRDQFVCIKIF